MATWEELDDSPVPLCERQVEEHTWCGELADPETGLCPAHEAELAYWRSEYRAGRLTPVADDVRRLWRAMLDGARWEDIGEPTDGLPV